MKFKAKPKNTATYIVAARITQEQGAALEKLASKHNTTISDIIRQMIGHCLGEDE